MTLAELRSAMNSMKDLDGKTEVFVSDDFSKEPVTRIGVKVSHQKCSLGHEHPIERVFIGFDGRIR
jgi:hypothetical protein